MIQKPDRVFTPFAVLVLATPLWLSFLSVARNRLVAGQPMALLDLAVAAPTWVLVSGMAMVLVGAIMRGSVLILGGGLIVAMALIWLAGDQATVVTIGQPSARVSLGAAFWVMQAAVLLAVAEAARRLGSWAMLAALLGVVLPLTFLLMSGRLDALSLLREYANRRDIFGPAVLRHLGLVAAAMVPTLLIGIPLGLVCHRNNAVARVVMPTLGLIQTIPSIALFGLLMAPLSGLSALVPFLGRAGIGGIGVAPAVIALVLYSLLPITRNTASGLASVPPAVREAALGMGMDDRQRFWRVDLPLAFPVLLAGIRITVVQAIGLAAVAALIGAGGLGAIMFDGLFAGAIDLALLGALPVIAMAVTVDLLLRLAAPASA